MTCGVEWFLVDVAPISTRMVVEEEFSCCLVYELIWRRKVVTTLNEKCGESRTKIQCTTAQYLIIFYEILSKNFGWIFNQKFMNRSCKFDNLMNSLISISSHNMTECCPTKWSEKRGQKTPRRTSRFFWDFWGSKENNTATCIISATSKHHHLTHNNHHSLQPRNRQPNFPNFMVSAISLP